MAAGGNNWLQIASYAAHAWIKCPKYVHFSFKYIWHVDKIKSMVLNRQSFSLAV